MILYDSCSAWVLEHRSQTTIRGIYYSIRRWKGLALTTRFPLEQPCNTDAPLLPEGGARSQLGIWLVNCAVGCSHPQ